jgi:PKD repeat protein
MDKSVITTFMIVTLLAAALGAIKIIQPQPDPEIYFSFDSQAFVNQPVSFHIHNLPEKLAYKVEWGFGITGNIDSRDTAPRYFYPKPGEYNVVLNIVSKEPITKKIKVVEKEIPLPQISIEGPAEAPVNKTVKFSIRNAGNDSLIEWNFGDNRIQNSHYTTMNYKYGAEGSYTITASTGGKRTTSKSIRIYGNLPPACPTVSNVEFQSLVIDFLHAESDATKAELKRKLSRFVSDPSSESVVYNSNQHSYQSFNAWLKIIDVEGHRSVHILEIQRSGSGCITGIRAESN